MERSKLDALFWEQNMFANLIVQGETDIEQENLDNIPFKCIDEFRILRDDNYNIKLICNKNVNQFSESAIKKEKIRKEILPGTWIPQGKISLRLFDEFQIVMSPCYYKGEKWKTNKTEYKIHCCHLEGKSLSKETVFLKEWLINGSSKGLCFCVNETFKYTVGEKISGLYGELEFPGTRLRQVYECAGNFVHIKYKDTAFDIHYINNEYGPKWSNNISISYYKEYGRIPDDKERNIIREYISFLSGKRLIYTGESHYDQNGDMVGFVMESPKTYDLDIKRICANAEVAPIRNDYQEAKTYFKTFVELLEPFENLYYKLDFQSLFSACWYAHEIAKPMDLPILAGALEHLVKKWYSEIGLNPETVLINKKDFSKRIKPIKKMMEKQFEGTKYIDRMKNSISNINKMSISEQFSNFFEEIGIAVGEKEKQALKARNFSAHGSYVSGEENYYEQFELSRIYENLIARIVLKLLGYTGKYVDRGTIGFPERNIAVPIGGDE